MTNQEIKDTGLLIRNEQHIGGNTALRVGGVIEGIGDALNNKDAANGYYEARMSGGSIIVTAPNYVLGTGGNLRLKMPAAGTTASTLTIGNASQVPLLYNGAAVSSANTWEQDEIISVFYDGTRFMASNSQGGGGKAEKIKYDNSQSGLAAGNVQEALDEIDDNIESRIDLFPSINKVDSSQFVRGYYNRSGNLVSNASYNSGKISVAYGNIVSYRIMVGNTFDPYAYRLIAFDANNHYIPLSSVTGDSQVSSEYVDGLYVVPEGVSFVCACSRTMNDVYVNVCNVNLFDILKVQNIDNSMMKENLAFPSVANISPSMLIRGYYNRSGSFVSNASYNSGKINVTQGQIVFYRIRVSAGFDPYAYRLIAFNGQNVYIPSKSVTGNAQSTMYISDVYVVPEGVSSICVSTMSRDEAYVKVCESHLMETLKDIEKCYYVGAGHSYGSLIGLFESLKGDTSKKTIYIDAGTYDIFQDYLDNNITPPANGQTNTADYFNYNSFLPPNTRLVGLGKVVLEMKPTKQQLLNYAQSLSDTTDVNARALIISKIWSPLNIGGACEIENIMIETKNVRYCIHDDMHGADADSVHIYHNVNCIMNIPEDINGEALGFSITVGMGWASGSRHEYNDCVFENKNSKRSFYGHGTPSKGSNLTFNHCAFIGDANYNDSVNFQTLKNDVYSKVLIAGCYIMGTIRFQLYNGATHNSFDLTVLNCNQIVGSNPKYRIDDSSNPYPIKEY